MIFATVLTFGLSANAHARFLQTDPVGYGDNTNLYMFVANDPVNNFDPNGTICISLNNDSAFCKRSRLFNKLNQNPKIRSKTTFFGAASIITEALASKDLSGGGLFINEETNIFLNSLGATLEKHNLAQAQSILSGTSFKEGTVAQNDQELISSEQDIVQGKLDALISSDSEKFGSIVGDINGVLNGEGVKFSDPKLSTALIKVRTELGRDIDFANQGDRELIGNTLAAEQRTLCLRGSADKLKC